ncbi:MAG: hypothetical protein R3E31_28470 [Chloroflexota bacterium]
MNLLIQMSKRLPPGSPDPLLLLRGMPHNVTTEMDLTLWRTALAIRNDSEAAAVFAAHTAAELAASYLQGALPVAAQTAVADFLDQYGMRGIGEIDMGRRRWREDPTPVMQNLQSYLQIPVTQAPDVLFAKGAAEAEAAVRPLLKALRRTRRGWLKAVVAKTAVSRMRALAGVRESPKFFMIRALGMIRAGLLTSGGELAAAGILTQPDDLFYLHFSELKQLALQLENYQQLLIYQKLPMIPFSSLLSPHSSLQSPLVAPPTLASKSAARFPGCCSAMGTRFTKV